MKCINFDVSKRYQLRISCQFTSNLNISTSFKVSVFSVEKLFKENFNSLPQTEMLNLFSELTPITK